MGTRSLTVMQDEEEKEIAVLYRQFDGYPEVHGAELKTFLENRKIVNGIRGDDNNIFNGMSCLAASLVSHFKNDVGGFYLYPAGTRDCGEDYIYFISGKIGDNQATLEYKDAYEENSTLKYLLKGEKSY